MSYRTHLPQLGDELFLTDGGFETTLVFHEGIDLPDFAAFPLLDSEAARPVVDRYLEPYLAAAREHGTGFVAETPTWRANPDWGDRLGYDAAGLERINRTSVADLVAEREQFGEAPFVISGNLGPRSDGYSPAFHMGADDAARYHDAQIGTFADTEADLVTALTLTYVDEAVGIVRAAQRHDIPAVVSFTVETDGRLPDGTPLGRAIEQTDAATDAGAAYFMVNCAHPTHLDHGALGSGEAWVERIGGLRANASTLSHAELDEATELDDGDPADLAARYQALRAAVPSLRVLGGCCGTDHRHIGAIADACLPVRATT